MKWHSRQLEATCLLFFVDPTCLPMTTPQDVLPLTIDLYIMKASLFPRSHEDWQGVRMISLPWTETFPFLPLFLLIQPPANPAYTCDHLTFSINLKVVGGFPLGPGSVSMGLALCTDSS